MDVMSKEYATRRIPELEQLWETRRSPAALADLAGCYFTLDQPERAISLIEHVWETHKDPSVAMNMAVILKDLARHEESFRVIEQAYWQNPDDFYIRLGYSEAMLRAGFWKQAWPTYDNARPTQQAAAADLRIPASCIEWKSEPLPKDHLLLVINEGGAGDRMSYARWLPKLTEWGINWIFFPYAELFSMFEKILPRERLVKDGDDIEPTHWTTTFALPARFNVGPNEIPPPLDFTAAADKEHIDKYKIPRPDNLPVFGICYDAAEKYQGDRKVRSLSEGQAMRLVCMTGNSAHWVNLQHGRPMPFPVSNIPFETWEDTAGLIHNLDAVVSVDTSVMHLAGAMRKPLATILSGNSCWKFLSKGSQCKWYPTSTLFRNHNVRGMENSVNDLIVAIRKNEWPAPNPWTTNMGCSLPYKVSSRA